MRALGLHGARGGKKIRTTIPGPGHQRAADLVKRDFTCGSPTSPTASSRRTSPGYLGAGLYDEATRGNHR
ncbi:hypothetical protein [Microbispora sp. CA-102843]|uniref:hypothetical protein n=1 Tax=Microbispora sp. CA-102843 TaxID=3239952 RepID=UPI003D903208